MFAHLTSEKLYHAFLLDNYGSMYDELISDWHHVPDEDEALFDGEMLAADGRGGATTLPLVTNFNLLCEASEPFFSAMYEQFQVNMVNRGDMTRIAENPEDAMREDMHLLIGEMCQLLSGLCGDDGRVPVVLLGMIMGATGSSETDVPFALQLQANVTVGGGAPVRLVVAANGWSETFFWLCDASRQDFKDAARYTTIGDAVCAAHILFVGAPAAVARSELI